MNALVIRLSRSLIFLCLLTIHATAWGQPTANFGATPQSGCSPLIVSFKDGSSGAPTQWRWDLGNGVISTLQNPSATYFNPGTYSIKLVVRNAAGVDSVIKTGFITVYAAPIPNFNASDTAGCFPLPVKFTDASLAGSGTITSWQWDFGDGTVSTLQHPVHVYTASGNYSVTLKVTNSNGCVKILSRTQHIKITTGVTAAFVNNTPGSCRGPVDIQFTNNSSGPGPLSYIWHFGDGAISTASNPTHTYSADGSYTVSLITISPQGCRDTIVKNNLVNLGVMKSIIAAPDTACALLPVTFNNASSPSPSAQMWDFGDGTFSSDANPFKTYSAVGIYTIRLVNNFGGCTDTVTKKMSVIAKPVASFSVNATVFCKVPSAVSFSAGATGASTFSWHFGDGTTGTGTNPTHVYTSPGMYTVTLIATNKNGCSDTLIKQDYITIQKPQVTLSGLPRTGCIPLTINPKAAVVASQPVAKYFWNFGDGSTSSSINPSHTYTVAGTYHVSLIVTTTGGCADTVIYNEAVRVGTKPSPSFTVNPTDVCAFKPVTFTDKTSGKVDQWLWSFGDGSSSTVQNPKHEYSDTGWFNVELIAWNNTCPDTFRVKNAVHVRPPIAAFTVMADCAEKYSRIFTNTSVGATSWLWNFDDGTTSSEKSPNHTFSAKGSYNVSLTVTNGSCTHQTTQLIRIVDEKSNFITSDSVVCRNSVASFAAKNIDSSNITSWNWNFGDGIWSTDPSATRHTYSQSGVYIVTLTITDINNCVSVKTGQVKVVGAVAAFNTSAPAACLNDNAITFTDASTTDGIRPITKYIWTFGDGKTDSSSIAPFVHKYYAAGSYDLSLSVRDAYGCTDMVSKPAAVVIAQPVAGFFASDSLSCTTGLVSFINASTASNPVFHWTFGDGHTSGDANPTHTFNKVGLYDVSLLVVDQYGCRDSLKRSSYINVSQPKASFVISDSIGTCPPMQVHFTNTSSHYTSYHWDFGDGTTSSLINPSHFYTTAGIFYPMLVVQGPGGCTDTLRRKIIVKGPSGSLSYTPISGCKPLEVAFTATTANAATFVWDFSDGTTLSTSELSVAHTYTNSGAFVPKIILIDANGCNVPITGTDTVKVTGITAGFTATANSFCDAATVAFTNTTVSNDYITGYTWNFGDGGSSTEPNPSHFYSKPGRYTISLSAKSAMGCEDAVSYTDTIVILPRPQVQAKGGGVQCASSSFAFNGAQEPGSDAVISWQWDFANGQTSTLQNPPGQFYKEGTYTIQVIASGTNGCKDTAINTITVSPMPQTNAGADVLICRGSFAKLVASGADRYVWNNASSLSCTDCSSPLAAPTDSTQYVVTGITAFGCMSMDSVVVRVQQPFTVVAQPGDTLCLGGTAKLKAAGADLYTWTPTMYVSNPANGITTVKPVATTTYQVIGRDLNNCFADTAEVFIKVYPIPTVSAGPDQTLIVGNAVTLSASYSADVVYYKWSDNGSLNCSNCRVPVAQPRQTTTYTVEVKNEGGCTATDQMTIFVVCEKGNLYIPNTFSPNGDGSNDRFYPNGTGINMIKSLRVFNRWGEVVFERAAFSANDPAAGWDGTFKGQPLSSDVYIYTCEVVCQNNEILQFKGDVTLLK